MRSVEFQPTTPSPTSRWLGLVARFAMVLALSLLLGGWTWYWQIGGESEEGIGGTHDVWFGKGWTEEENALRDLNFSHQIHVEGEELECSTCHAGAEEEARAGMPEMSVCEECHDEVDDSSEEKSGCLMCHIIQNLPPECTDEECPEDALPDIETQIGPQPYSNLRYSDGEESHGFSHQTHFDKGIECEQCHDGIAGQEVMPMATGQYMPKPQRCFDCHGRTLGNFTHKRHADKEVPCADCHGDSVVDEVKELPADATTPEGGPNSVPGTCAACHKPVSSSCETCHVSGTYDQKVEPDTHRAGWLRFHGTAARLNLEGQHGKDCATCHAQQTCAECHNTRPPQDHTNFWRTRGHGLMAAGDRERCITCHRQDFCEACHNETAPRTHIGTWATGKHCPWCHLESGFSTTNDNCRACHRAIKHTTAPHPINTANCFGSGCHSPSSGIAPLSMRR